MSFSDYIKKVAHYIPDSDKMMMILQFCDIDFGNVKLTGAPLPTWSLIFTEAYGQNKVEALFEELGKQYADLKVNEEELALFKEELDPDNLQKVVRISKTRWHTVTKIVGVLCLAGLIVWIWDLAHTEKKKEIILPERNIKQELGLKYFYTYKAKGSIYTMDDFTHERAEELKNKSEDYFVENYMSSGRKRIGDSEVWMDTIPLNDGQMEVRLFSRTEDILNYAAFVVTMDSSMLMKHYSGSLNRTNWMLYGEGDKNELFYRGNIKDTMKIVLNLNSKKL